MSGFKKLAFIVSIVLGMGLSFLNLPLIVQAQPAGEEIGRQLEAAAGPGGANLGEPTDPRVTVIFIVRVFLGLIAILLLSLNLYAGFLWMTAGGNEEQVTKAKTTLRNGVIGLIIVLSAYSITIFAANLARGYSSGYGGSPFYGAVPFIK